MAATHAPQVPDPTDLCAVELVALTRKGSLGVIDVATAVADRISRRDSTVRAWAHFDAAELLERGRALDARAHRGPLHGVPLAVKDVFLTRDLPTGQGSPRWTGHRPGLDAALVETLRSAGALLVGKSVTTEFAATLRGAVTRNPLDPSRTPGGSSSGSAAAVADRQSALAIGTQTGGSTIRPASFTGIWALKPTWGAVSIEGAKVGTPTCDTIGLFSRQAADLMLLADVLDLDQAPGALPISLGGVRVGVCRTPWWDAAEDGTRAALPEAVRRLRAAGAEVMDLDLPGDFAGLQRAQHVLGRRETRATFRNELVANPGLHDEFRARAEGRESFTARELRAAYDLAERCRSGFDIVTDELDIVLAPSARGEAPVGLAHTGGAELNTIWTLLHVPVVNVPGLVGPQGLPVGLSVVGRRFEDRLVLAVATLLGDLLSAHPARGASAQATSPASTTSP